jgi:hypothetical protein
LGKLSKYRCQKNSLENEFLTSNDRALRSININIGGVAQWIPKREMV